MRRASEDGRIGHVPYDPRLPVETWWDIGYSDYNVIWFAQHSIGEIRLIKCIYGNGATLTHWASEIDRFQKANGDVVYSRHILPHDGNHHSYQSGKTIKKALQDLGCGPIKVNRKDDFMAGILETRAMLSKCWFDERGCGTGIEGLRQYRRKALEGIEDPDHNQVFSNEPLHNWASHFADALRTGAMGSRPEQRSPTGGEERLYAPMAMV